MPERNGGSAYKSSPGNNHSLLTKLQLRTMVSGMIIKCKFVPHTILVGLTAMINNSEQRNNTGSPSDTNGNGNNDNLSRIIEGDPEYAKDFNNAY